MEDEFRRDFVDAARHAHKSLHLGCVGAEELAADRLDALVSRMNGSASKVLAELTDHREPWVRLFAAEFLLGEDPDLAHGVLDGLTEHECTCDRKGAMRAIFLAEGPCHIAQRAKARAASRSRVA